MSLRVYTKIFFEVLLSNFLSRTQLNKIVVRNTKVEKHNGTKIINPRKMTIKSAETSKQNSNKTKDIATHAKVHMYTLIHVYFNFWESPNKERTIERCLLGI